MTAREVQEFTPGMTRIEGEIRDAARRHFRNVNPSSIRVSFENGRWWVTVEESSYEDEVYRVDGTRDESGEYEYSFESVGREVRA